MGKRDDLNTPEGLTDRGKLAHEITCRVLRDHGLTYTGGCTPFHNPAAWGGDYGNESHLVIVYDGGEVREACDPYGSDFSAYKALADALLAHGLYVQACTGYYSAVYDA